MWTAPLICERRVLIPASKHRAKLMTTRRVALCEDRVHKFWGNAAGPSDKFEQLTIC